MKQFNEYLSTKVAKPLVAFPNTRNLDEIIEFLEKHGFERLIYDEKEDYGTIIKEFSNSKREYPNGRFYMYKIAKSSNKCSWVRFADEGTRERGNLHMFFIFYDKLFEGRIAGFTEDMTYANDSRVDFETYDELIDKINDSIVW